MKNIQELLGFTELTLGEQASLQGGANGGAGGAGGAGKDGKDGKDGKSVFNGSNGNAVNLSADQLITLLGDLLL